MPPREATFFDAVRLGRVASPLYRASATPEAAVQSYRTSAEFGDRPELVHGLAGIGVERWQFGFK
jgi:hypothetical protein